ncbi:unnamed protein product [Parascedosporium putredinis]|uniref:Carboxylic ester hydrolase n=1 Tax=Parascedosporium putredinis TaxID=1442378 RepID=A0A9P1H2S1_9PEZI|nr:unnamed protein product [Parascedosporium putredinis]CAI7995216.1 unnamed protein product [Parascedosporium putredinis]
MKYAKLQSVLFLHAVAAHCTPRAYDSANDVTYKGLVRNGIEVFLNIPYGQDTGGANRFKPPRPHVPVAGSTVKAQSYGPSCPQPLGAINAPLALTPIVDVSEDCLNLNIARPDGTEEGDELPVIVWIHGGGFWTGSNSEITTAPDGMVQQSVENGNPIIHVAVNYRLGFFGFAQSDALLSEGSTNAGMRDQRLALEWVRDNIEYFGGDPNRVTIFGQSSGGLAVGLHLLAYGGDKPVPFQRAIAQSQCLEPGLTGTFTIDAMQALVDHIGCNEADLHSDETVECLRAFDTENLLNASIATKFDDLAHNIGDIWLPSVDGDFLPAAPSELIRDGRLAIVPTMFGWTDKDLNIYVSTDVKTAEQTHELISAYLPGVTSDNIDTLLSLYPVSDFEAGSSEDLVPEFHRSARIVRDIIMSCEPLFYAQQLRKHGNKDLYVYDWNQTVFDPLLEHFGLPAGMGPDEALLRRGSRTWSTFATYGKPSLEGHETFEGVVGQLQDELEIYERFRFLQTDGIVDCGAQWSRWVQDLNVAKFTIFA